MKTVTVSASKKYNVYIGNGLLTELGGYALQVKKPCKAAIISESNVWPLYGHTAAKALEQSGFSVCHFVFPAGEASKNGATYLQILSFLAENQLTRSDLVIALGGGVTGDITGFAAATYLRGISCIQIPTTLLAMVDSSVGGKTAIDLPAGKNLAGAFYQPNLVLCDLDCLNSLPRNIFLDGCAEVIKYGVLFDKALFAHLQDNGPDFDQETVIARCVELKRDIVAMDEFDRGERQKLNLGHTIGHSIEANSNFTISHGKAVAAGMAIVSRASAKYGICSESVSQEICNVLSRFDLPTNSDCSANQLFSTALSDKKRSGGSVNLILPREIGDCIISPTRIEVLENFIEAGL